MADLCFFSGVWSKDRKGHFLYIPQRECFSNDVPKDFPVREWVLDGALLPPNLPQHEGRAICIQLSGWTILSFWDRSADERYNSCASFVMRGVQTFEEAIAIAKAAFPGIWNRFSFEVKP